MQKLAIKNKRLNENIATVVFLTPAFAFLLLYVVYSTIDAFRLSLFDWNGIDPKATYIGLGNWKELLNDSIFTLSFKHNVIIIVLSLVIQLPIALALAIMLDCGGRKVNFLKVLYYIPSLLSTAAVGVLFRYIYDPINGIVSAITNFLGYGNIDLLGSSKNALYAVFSVICWTAIPFHMIYFLAGLTSLSQEVYEASIIDGATRPKYYLKIALPMLKPVIRNVVILSMIGSLKYFDLIFVMTEGGPNNSSDLMATYMYRISFRYMRLGYGATVAAAMFILISVISIAVLLVLNRKADE